MSATKTTSPSTSAAPLCPVVVNQAKRLDDSCRTNNSPSSSGAGVSPGDKKSAAASHPQTPTKHLDPSLFPKAAQEEMMAGTSSPGSASTSPKTDKVKEEQDAKKKAEEEEAEEKERRQLPLVLIFDFRSIVDSGDIERAHNEAWTETLGAFGYGSFTHKQYMQDLAMRSTSDVMTRLCPYTTRREWPPLVNKRDARMTQEVKDMCYVNCPPIKGFREFLLSCEKQQHDASKPEGGSASATPTSDKKTPLPSAGELNSHNKVKAIVLSPFEPGVNSDLLSHAELERYIAHCFQYESWDYALLEALEELNMPPPRIPVHMRTRWNDSTEVTSSSDDDDEAVAKAKGDDGSEEEEKAKKKRVRFDEPKKDEGEDDEDSSIGVPANIYCFTSLVETAKLAKQLGIKTFGVSYNNVDQDVDVKANTQRPVLDGCPTEEDLLKAGCKTVLRSYEGLKAQFLPKI